MSHGVGRGRGVGVGLAGAVRVGMSRATPAATNKNKQRIARNRSDRNVRFGFVVENCRVTALLQKRARECQHFCGERSYSGKRIDRVIPIRVRSGKCQFVQGLPIDDFSRAKIDASVAELKEEKSLVSELIS